MVFFNVEINTNISNTAFVYTFLNLCCFTISNLK